MITGIALANLMSSLSVTMYCTEKLLKGVKPKLKREHLRFPVEVACVIDEVEVAWQLGEHVHQICIMQETYAMERIHQHPIYCVCIIKAGEKNQVPI
jgi:hypothetical protein